MKKIHYAWVVCFACTLLMISNMGLCSNILTVYLPFIERSGITDSQGSAILSVRCFFSFISIFCVTKYYKLVPLRLGIIAASVIGVLSAVVFSIGGSVAVYFIAAALAGIAYGLGSTIPMSLVITNWFNGKRGLAMGICSAGTGISTVIFSPVLTDIIEKHSLQVAFMFQAAYMLLAALVVWLLIREFPQQKNLEPYGTAECEQEKSVGQICTIEFSFLFWILLYVMMVLIGGAGQSFNGHMSVLVTSCGYSVRIAAVVSSLFGFSLMVGKMIFGSISDAIGTKRATILFIIIFLAGNIPVIFMDGKTDFLCYVFGILLGFGAAIFALGSSLWALDLSQEGHYGDTLRKFQMCYSLGGIVFSTVPGLIADRTGEYKTSYLLFALMVTAGLAILLCAYRKKEKAEKLIITKKEY